MEDGIVTLTGIVEKEGDQYVSYCRELGVASCGNTIDEALANLDDAIQVHIDALVETGELLQVFRERNIRIDLQAWQDEPLVRAPPGKIITTFHQHVPITGVA